MRLDHLLSKEHLPPRPAVVGRTRLVGDCPTLGLVGGDTGKSRCLVGSCVSTAHLWVGTRGGSAGGVVVETSCWVLKEQPGPRWGIPFGGGVLAGVVCSRCSGVVVVSGRCHLPSNRVVCGCAFGCGCAGCRWWVWVVGGVLFENCTVDASIFVVKFVRANGGCLGTRSR